MGAPHFCRNIRHLVQKLADVALIAAFLRQSRVIFPITGRINARRASKRIHNKARIIRNGYKTSRLGGSFCLYKGILRKSFTRFLRLLIAWEISQGFYSQAQIFQLVPKFRNLAPIGCCQNDFPFFHPVYLWY